MFSRSFAFKAFAHSCPKASPSPRLLSSSPTLRFFSSSVPRTKSATPRKTPHQKPIPSAQPKSASPSDVTLQFAGRRPAGFAKLERKVAKEGEVVLYKSPSQRRYIVSAYITGGFCIAYAFYNSYATFYDPVVVLPKWQQLLTGGVCFVMSAMGTVFIMRTRHLIKGVKAVSSNGQATIRFTVRHGVPFMKSFQVDALPRQIAIARRAAASPGAQRPMPSDSKIITVLKAPFKYLSMGIWNTFLSIRQVFTQGEFVYLEIAGQRIGFRMDSKGQFSEDFFTLGDPFSAKR